VDNERGRAEPHLAPSVPLNVPAEPRKDHGVPATAASTGPDARLRLGRGAARRAPLDRSRDWLGRRGPIYAVIALGGFFGGNARYALGLVWPDVPGRYPWTTFGINVSGAFVLALLLVLILEAWDAPTWLRPLVGTGFLGAFTTFSSVAFALNRFAVADQWPLFCAYLAFSVLAGLAAASFGVVLAHAWVAARAKGSTPDLVEEAAADLDGEPGADPQGPKTSNGGSTR